LVEVPAVEAEACLQLAWHAEAAATAAAMVVKQGVANLDWGGNEPLEGGQRLHFVEELHDIPTALLLWAGRAAGMFLPGFLDFLSED
jgi:hypothetical protein